jgi:hypothetical protein
MPNLTIYSLYPHSVLTAEYAVIGVKTILRQRHKRRGPVFQASLPVESLLERGFRDRFGNESKRIQLQPIAKSFSKKVKRF